MRTITTLLLLLCTVFYGFGQDNDPDKKGIRYRIFLPSLEIGYVGYSSQELSGGVMVKTAIEYRLKTQDSFYFRLNYDNRRATYKIQPTGLTNVIEGKVNFSDLIGGVGYRFGKDKLQWIVLLQGGVSFYDVPEFELAGTVLNLRNKGKNVPISRLTIGLEYYLDSNSAITLELLQSQFWNQEDFWQDNQSAWGISLGVTATLY
ncbi:hypothetical protein BKI52_38500 [marine bacterium AO1-C]|nr:hypothetical protein BKI52_38500 [marine bacterium AO1-C]